MSNIRLNLFFAFIYNAAGIPTATGLLCPFFGLLLSPILAGAAMSLIFRQRHRERTVLAKWILSLGVRAGNGQALPAPEKLNPPNKSHHERQLFEKAGRDMQKLDAIMNNKYSRQPEKLRVWQTASRIERGPQREKKTPPSGDSPTFELKKP